MTIKAIKFYSTMFAYYKNVRGKFDLNVAV